MYVVYPLYLYFLLNQLRLRLLLVSKNHEHSKLTRRMTTSNHSLTPKSHQPSFSSQTQHTRAHTPRWSSTFLIIMLDPQSLFFNQNRHPSGHSRKWVAFTTCTL